MRARIVAISDPKAIYKYPNKINMLITAFDFSQEKIMNF